MSQNYQAYGETLHSVMWNLQNERENVKRLFCNPVLVNDPQGVGGIKNGFNLLGPGPNPTHLRERLSMDCSGCWFEPLEFSSRTTDGLSYSHQKLDSCINLSYNGNTRIP